MAATPAQNNRWRGSSSAEHREMRHLARLMRPRLRILQKARGYIVNIENNDIEIYGEEVT